MDTSEKWVVSIPAAGRLDTRIIGGKARKLAQLHDAGFRIPRGFCITVAAYQHFLDENRLFETIRMELGRKPFDAMRYEEIWDAALRIRSAFLSAPLPPVLVQAIADQRAALPSVPLAVRSSSPGEDTAEASFAGLHESVIDVIGPSALLNAVRVVWASLWSDAALLYQRELALDPLHSRMAVVVQEMIEASCSGVAFGRDPRHPADETAVIEAVPGKCRNLVDGTLDPDRWLIHRLTGEIVEWHPGERDEPVTKPALPLLAQNDLAILFQTLQRAENRFGWPPDMEWTDTGENLTVLQVRPISTVQKSTEASDKRSWYLSLRPRHGHLKKLADRVSRELIPALEQEGERFESQTLTFCDDQQLARAIEERNTALEKWKKIYWDAFIPFAHGVRQLGIYYNDAVQPEDPYEFVDLLRGESMLAGERNQRLIEIAETMAADEALYRQLAAVVAETEKSGTPLPDWPELSSMLEGLDGKHDLATMFESLLHQHMNVVFNSVRLDDHPELLFKTAFEMARRIKQHPEQHFGRTTGRNAAQLEKKLLDAVGTARHHEAREMLMLGRLSWRLRDDDNILIGRLENQLLRSLQLAAERLQKAGRLQAPPVINENAAPVLAMALRQPELRFVKLPESPKAHAHRTFRTAQTQPRQLTGQPGSPGIVSGKVKKIIDIDDFSRFREGRILVCDAVQPSMTHLVPLAGAIVERRGGMLIHSAIIARELGIPCVNGIEHVVEWLHDDDWVTVDGYLGILTIGPPEFHLELNPPSSERTSIFSKQNPTG